MHKQDTYLILGSGSDVGSTLMNRILEKDSTALILAQYKSHPPKSHSQITPLYCDLNSDSSLEEFLQNLQPLPLPNKIIHLASNPVSQAPFKKMEWNAFEGHINIGLKSIFYVLKEVLPKLAKEDGKDKKVVFMLSSVICGKPPAGMADYVSVKYALLGLLKSLASEYKNIQFNAISPTMMETKFLSNLDPRIPELKALNHPRKRNAKLEDILGALEFLLDSGSEFMTANNLNISGGEIFS